MPATITSLAHYFPPDIYPNSYFESYLDTSNEWIVERTGIRERRFSKNGATSDLIVPAARQCLQQRGLSPESIDCIIVSTVTPDFMFPATAAVVQNKLGLKNAWGFDLSAACSGYLFGLVTAAKLVESGAVRNVLLCGADKMSAIVDFQDRAQAVLFGDGAAVTLIEMSNDPELGILDHLLRIDGEGGEFLYQAAGGSFKPASIETVQNREHYIHQEGQAVFKAAVIGMADVTLEIMKKNNLTGEDVDWLVPHQANLRIITATAQRMELPMEKVMVNIDKYANTTAATIPSCLSDWHQAGKLKRGDRLILASFGAGFTWGAVYMRWSMD